MDFGGFMWFTQKLVVPLFSLTEAYFFRAPDFIDLSKKFKSSIHMNVNFCACLLWETIKVH